MPRHFADEATRVTRGQSDASDQSCPPLYQYPLALNPVANSKSHRPPQPRLAPRGQTNVLYGVERYPPNSDSSQHEHPDSSLVAVIVKPDWHRFYDGDDPEPHQNESDDHHGYDHLGTCVTRKI